MVVSIHVPKCAGTSFRQVLDELCGDGVWYNYGTVFTRDQARQGLVPAGTQIIHGHFIADSFDDLFPDRRLVTWVRHPVESVVSNYYHFMRSPDMRDDCCRAVQEQRLNLMEFADLEWMRNEATRYLANRPVDDFAFVGISDCFSESIAHFCSVFGFRDVFRIPRANTNPMRTSEHYPISRQEHAHILKRNQADLEWYNRAFDRLIREAGISVVQVA
jgi:hypothetical protein